MSPEELRVLRAKAIAGSACLACDHAAVHCIASGCNADDCECDEYDPVDEFAVDEYRDACVSFVDDMLALLPPSGIGGPLRGPQGTGSGLGSGGKRRHEKQRAPKGAGGKGSGPVKP